MDSGIDLHTFRTRLVQKMRAKESELSDLKAKLNAVDEVLEMIKGEAVTTKPSESNGRQPGGLYSDMGAKEAVKRLLLDHADREWGVKEVRDNLLQNGFKPTTKHIYSVLSATLDRLAKEDFVNLEKTDEGKRYRKIVGSAIQTALNT